MDVPSPTEPTTGPLLKFAQLATRFSSTPAGFNLLYLGSSGLPSDLTALIRFARRRSIPIVVNQNGVGYPAWAGAGWERFNRPLQAALAAADHVMYQSEFCRLDADRYLGPADGTWEILHNAVDVGRFVPADDPPGEGPIMLLAGDQTSPRRFELALRTLAVVVMRHPSARLLVTGRLPADAEALFAETEVRGSVELVGSYPQDQAPLLYHRAHLLLHTKVNDPCPNVVLEALASGLPVVYPASGGTPELVGDAGIAVPHEESHDVLLQPSPEALAAGVDAALRDRELLARRARERAVARFPLDRWLDRHAEVFDELLSRRPAL